MSKAQRDIQRKPRILNHAKKIGNPEEKSLVSLTKFQLWSRFV